MEECEDAFLIDSGAVPGAVSERFISVAVADGASESIMASAWAEAIVESVTSYLSANDKVLSPGEAYESFLSSLRLAWGEFIDAYLGQRLLQKRPLKWYERAKIDAGEFSTFLAFRLRVNSEGLSLPTWKVAAIGDTCFFHVRDGRVIESFPIQAADDFSTRTDLLSSRPNRLLSREIRFLEGTCIAGDRLYFMTDALAAWFIRISASSGRQALRDCIRDINWLMRHDDAASFAEWIGRKREDGSLHNDDVTLIQVAIGD